MRLATAPPSDHRWPTVWTPSRLHFGLLSLGRRRRGVAGRRGERVLPARRFGGVGLMVERPGVQVAAAAAAWSADGPLAERALAFALRFAESVRRERPELNLPPQRLDRRRGPVGTRRPGRRDAAGAGRGAGAGGGWGLVLDAPDLARRVGRGLRRRSASTASSTAAFWWTAANATRTTAWRRWRRGRRSPPNGGWCWRCRARRRGLHGCEERQAFARLPPGRTRRRTDALCRLALLGMLPALAEGDLEAFGEVLHDFNARVGEAFAAVQGGVYAARGWPNAWRSSAGKGFAAWDRVPGGRPCSRSWKMRTGGRPASALADRFGLGPAEVWVSAGCNGGRGGRAVSPGDRRDGGLPA